MKKILTYFLGGTLLLGAGSMTIESNRIAIEQELVKSQSGKYLQYKINEYREGIQIDEYVAPTGSGYQVYEKEERKDGIYIRSYGEGPEKEQRSFNWKLFQELSTTTKQI